MGLYSFSEGNEARHQMETKNEIHHPLFRSRRNRRLGSGNQGRRQAPHGSGKVRERRNLQLRQHGRGSAPRDPIRQRTRKEGGGLMSPSEFKAARRKLGLSASQLGSILNTDPRTIRKWEDESGTRPPNPIACRVVEWMLNGYRPPEFPKSS
jgi:DNA-binding XRE family transcriptional regulator